MNVPQNKQFGSLRAHFGERVAHACLRLVGAARSNGLKLMRGNNAASQSDDIQRYIDGSPIKVGFGVLAGAIERLAPQEPQKNRLEHVLRVFGPSGHPVCCPINEPSMLVEDLLEFLGK